MSTPTFTQEDLKASRIIKKLSPGDSGTKDLLAYHGDELINVRYRRLPDGRTVRTVELIDYTITPGRGRAREGLARQAGAKGNAPETNDRESGNSAATS